jgi:hypothetical protein
MNDQLVSYTWYKSICVTLHRIVTSKTNDETNDVYGRLVASLLLSQSTQKPLQSDMKVFLNFTMPVERMKFKITLLIGLKNVLNTFVILIARKGINTGAMRRKLERGHPFAQKWEVYIKYLLCGIRLLMKRTPPNGTSHKTISFSMSTPKIRQNQKFKIRFT